MILLVKNSKWLCLCAEQIEGTDGEGVVTINLQTAAHSEGRKLRGSRQKKKGAVTLTFLSSSSVVFRKKKNRFWED